VLEGQLLVNALGHCRREEKIALARGLRLLQRRFGVCKESLRMTAIAGIHRYSHAGGEPKLAPIEPECRAQAGGEPLLGEAADIVLVLHISGNNRKVVRADPGCSRRIRTCGLDTLGKLPEQLVACLAPVGIIDRLEPLDIDDRDGEPALRAAGSNHLLLQALQKQAAVGEAGERVVIGEILELLRLLDMPERKRYVARQLEK